MRTLALFVLLSACAPFPEVDRIESPAARSAPFPPLLPVAAFDVAPDARLTATTGPALDDRVAALRARAESLRGPVLSATDRARLRR